MFSEIYSTFSLWGVFIRYLSIQTFPLTYFPWLHEFGVSVLVAFHIEPLEGVDMGGSSIIGGGSLHYIPEASLDMLNVAAQRSNSGEMVCG